MNRRRYEWRLKDRTLLLGERTLIMGILNVTPDSFSDGGRYDDPDRAYSHAVALEEAGADLIDIGAESTRPGSERITEAEEMRRLIPVLRRLRGKLSIPISVDTYKSAVAEKALDLGVEIVNDPSALTFDPLLARMVAQHNAGLVLNHMRGMPDSWAKLPPMHDTLNTITADLDAGVHRAVRAGVERARIVVDPGLGFGKRGEQNSEILARLPLLERLDVPLLIGPSRKTFLSQWHKSADQCPFDLMTAAAVTAAILNGAHIVRVHEVQDLKAVVHLADQILSFSGWGGL
jgi:dihydropteroate synthase